MDNGVCACLRYRAGGSGAGVLWQDDQLRLRDIRVADALTRGDDGAELAAAEKAFLA
jgi:hypothetical protein